MLIRAQFSQVATIRPGDIDWVASPLPGVDRLMLDRIGGEVARATTIVRYAAGSYFDPHTHSGGEEYLVLSGVFSDEHGDQPAGTYVRNPIGTAHKPFSANGCTIFVKLHQFAEGDNHQFQVDTKAASYLPTAEEGVSILPLHHTPSEDVAMLKLAPGAGPVTRHYPGGAELLVIEGTMSDQDGDYPVGSWLRLPPGSEHRISSADGTLIWTKTGHLAPDVLGKWTSLG